MKSNHLVVLACALGASIAASPALGQCPERIELMVASPLIWSPSAMTEWRPGATGPARLAIGSWQFISQTHTNSITSVWDSQTRTVSRLGPSSQNGATMDNSVGGVLALADGRLLFWGDFNSVAGVPAYGLAQWDGTNWSAFGGLASGGITSMQLLPGGDILATGAFTTSGGTTIAGLGRWNGTGWTQVASPITSGTNGAVVMPNGDIVARGSYTYVGSPLIRGVARWNGTQWSPLGLGLTLDAAATSSGTVVQLALLPNGNLVAAGSFNYAGGQAAKNIAIWNGTSWSALGAGTDAIILALHVLPGGDLIIGGSFTHAGTVNAAYLAKWSGSEWTELHGGIGGTVRALVPFDGDLVIAPFSGGALYRLTNRPTCLADFDCSGTLSVNDIFAFLATWFSGDRLADSNRSGEVSVQDVFDFLNAWFAGCP